MNTLIKTLGIAGIVLGVGACNCGERRGNTVKQERPRYETLTAKPVSVADNSGDAPIVTFTVTQGDEKILCTTYYSTYTRKYAMVNSMLKAELNDGDDQPVKVVGTYGRDDDGNSIFKFNELYVENYHFKF